ncbi:MAG TPA: hypothetical protein VKI65_14875, partial [Gemmataceae bacterium]|nr:hypothetical protein [Gemmataceae bacterium]
MTRTRSSLLTQNRFSRRRQPMQRLHPAKIRLHLERLEDRALPSVNLLTNFACMGPGDTSCGCVPPDTIAAAGPNHVVEMINTAVRVYDKSGTVLSTQELSNLFGPLGGVLNMSDPQVHYDELAGRWAIGVLDFDTTSNSRFDFAVSNDSDPTHGWILARYDMNDGIGSSFDFADYPRMGFNADAWVVSFNMYPNLSAGADHSDLLVVNKSTFASSPATSGTRIVVPGGQAHFTMVPAIVHGAVAGGPMYFVDTTEGQGEISGGGSVEAVQMTNVLSATPTFTGQTLAVSSYSIPPAATQKGTSETI